MSNSGPLLALKTSLEVMAKDAVIPAYVVKVPVKLANETLNLLRGISGSSEVHLQHLRRFARLDDLPHHLRVPAPESDLYLLVGAVASIKLSELEDCLSGALPGFGLRTVTVPLYPPTSPEQARLWSTSSWPTLYKKSNPFGPHPSIVSRAEAEIIRDLDKWMGMAMSIAMCFKSTGYGEPIGAVIVERRNQAPHAVALAGDSRWRGYERDGAGNPMAHAVLRAIGMVAQKLRASNAVMEYEQNIFLDCPLVPEEEAIYESGYIPSSNYLCHGLEIYVTHEPCVACSMALLHSRFARVIFRQRMERTGGLCSETRTFGPARSLGHGLFWRKELNWNMLAWTTEVAQPIDLTLHA